MIEVLEDVVRSVKGLESWNPALESWNPATTVTVAIAARMREMEIRFMVVDPGPGWPVKRMC